MLKSALHTIVLFLVCLSALMPAASQAALHPDPMGIALQAANNENVETQMTLMNDAEQPASFNILFSINDFEPVEGEEQQRGPRRDEPGEILREIDVPYFNTVGMAWDEEDGLMWALAWSDRRIYALNPENNEVVINVGLNASVLSMFYRNGSLYTGGYNNNPNTIFRYNLQGQMVESLRVPIDLNWTHTCADDSYLYTISYPNANGQGAVHVYDFDNNFDEVAVIDCNEWIGEDGYGIEIIHAHRDAWLWLSDRTSLYQFRVDEDWNPELVRHFETVESGHTGLAHDGENLWRGTYDGETRLWYVIDDGVPEKLNVTIDPRSGVVEAEDLTQISLTISPEDSDHGVYDGLITIDTWEGNIEDNPAITRIELSLVVSLESPVATIQGVITDATNGAPLPGAKVSLDQYIISRVADEEGSYLMTDLPRGVYNLTFTAPDYLIYREEVDISEGGEIEVNHAFLHSECTPSPDHVSMDLAPGSDTQVSIEITNGGNGDLTYMTERRLLGDANADPWTIRQSQHFGADREDSRIQGVVYANDQFYVAGAHNDEPAIYIFDHDGNYLDLFIQPGEDRRGMKDLTWDGELIWGAIGDIIYGFTVEGDVISTIESPLSPTNNLAWDPVNQWLWISSTTSDFAAIDLQGNQQAEINRNDLRSYGLAFWPDDPDNYPLYIFAKESDTNRPFVYKANPEDGDVQFVTYLDTEIAGTPAAAFITNQYDIYSWVMLTVISVADNEGGDRIDIWQVEPRLDWMLLEPEEGVIEAGSAQAFNLTLDASDLPPEIFEGEIVFSHDGIGSQTVIPITMGIVEGPVHTSRTIPLSIGWSIVSVYLQPDEEDIVALMQPVAEPGDLLMMKDGEGRFYNPEFHFNNIPRWNVSEGYMMKMAQASEITLEGVTVMADEPINLVEGWQIVAYYPRMPVDAIVALSGLGDALLMAKDAAGRFYNTEFNFSNMGSLEPLKGYLVKLARDAELVYRLRMEEENAASVTRGSSAQIHPGMLPIHEVTGANMSLLVYSDDLQDGELGIYAGEQLVGSGIIDNGVCGIAVWGDDLTTSELDGAENGERISLACFDGQTEIPVEVKIVAGDGLYKTDDFQVFEVSGSGLIPESFGISSVYPNPFNQQTRIEYSLVEASRIELNLFDLTGRKVLDLFSGDRRPGVYSTAVNGDKLSSGVYVLRLKSNTEIAQRKVVMVK